MRISKENAIEKLVRDGVSNDSGAAIRCGNAKRIFDEKQERNALINVTSSNRLPAAIINLAKEILNDIC